MDALKGFAASARLADGLLQIFSQSNPDPQASHIIAGIAAVLGHNYTCWLQFKGGKGIATTAGVFSRLHRWRSALPSRSGLWLCGDPLCIHRLHPCGDCPARCRLVYQANLALRIIAIIPGLLAIYKHKANIQRLMNGTRIAFNSTRSRRRRNEHHRPRRGRMGTALAALLQRGGHAVTIWGSRRRASGRHAAVRGK